MSEKDIHIRALGADVSRLGNRIRNQRNEIYSLQIELDFATDLLRNLLQETDSDYKVRRAAEQFVACAPQPQARRTAKYARMR